MIIGASKIGIIISLVMVAHALFYPNRFSLFIAIFGYIIAIGSATIYGLCKSNKNSQKGKTESWFEETAELFPKGSDDTTLKMSTPLLLGLNRKSVIQALIKEKDLDEKTYDISGTEKSDGFETFREKDWIKRTDDNKYEDDIPGYQ